MTENSWKTLRIVAKKRVHMCVATESNIVFYRNVRLSVADLEGVPLVP